MKKTLLSLTVAAFAFAAVAQNNQFVKPDKISINPGIQVKKNLIDILAPTQNTPNAVTPISSGAKALSKIRITTSYNPYTLLLSEATCLTANQQLNTIQFTHRTNAATINGNQVISSFSTDGGNTWDTVNIVYNNASFPARYPSGVIFNPAGNTNPLNAYSVVSGPFLNASGAGWIGSFFASMKLDGTNRNVQNISIGTTSDSVNFARMFFQATDNSVFVTANYDVNNGTNYTAFKTVLCKGKLNTTSNSMNWTNIAHVPDYPLSHATGFPEGTATPGVAFSKDGKTGYISYTGRHKTGPDTLSYLPLVYKTTDSGATWTKMADFDYGTLAEIQASLTPTGQGTTRPSFNRAKDVLVDANGNLHMAAFVYSASSDHPDSLGYIWTFTKIEGYMYDVYTTSTGGWGANFIGTCYGKAVPDASGLSGLLGWDERLQMSKSDDGTKVFYLWADTDTNLLSSPSYYSFLPDVYACGVDVNSGLRTNTVNFTAGTYQGDNFWMFTSNITLKSGSTYTIPVTCSAVGNADTDPSTHYFLKGVSFQESDFVTNPGVHENNALADVQNYPNPCKDYTKIEVNLTKAANLSVELFNMMGQKVMEINKGIGSTGINHITLNTSKLQNGVYFYTVKAGNNSITKKLIVQ